MTDLLDEIERLLSDLMQAGFATGGVSAAQRGEALALRCEAAGLHKASEILAGIAAELKRRPFQAEKNDRVLMGNICAAVRYVELGRIQLQEKQILERWQSLMADQGVGNI